MIRHPTGAVLLISLLAWLVMLLQHSPYAASLPPLLQLSHGPAAPGAAWVLGWLVMVLAMMLPPALPFLHKVSALVAARPWPQALLALAATLFMAAWTLAGLALAAASQLIAPLLRHWAWGAAHPALLTAAAATLAGAYQLSPLKRACLIACRSPVGLMLVHWRPRRAAASLAAITLRYAAVCIGCCWPLMALTLLVGAITLPVMVVVSLLMALERLLPQARPLVPIQAGFAFALALLLLLDPAGPAPGPAPVQAPVHHHH